MSMYIKNKSNYFPYSKPIKGNIDQLCNNPTNFNCKIVTDIKSCDSGYYPVIDCGITTKSTVCCPETTFPYNKTTDYCTYLTNQGCYDSQKDGDVSFCPSNTLTIADCTNVDHTLCCHPNISSNLNFTSTDAYVNNNGSLWNKNFAVLKDGMYEIGYGANSCIISSNGNLSLYTPVDNSPSGSPGTCGGTWEIKNMYEWYEPIQQFPATGTKYIPGGFTVYNNFFGVYLNITKSEYSDKLEVVLQTEPVTVAIYLNEDGTYRIMNAKLQIKSFYDLKNVGNPLECMIVDKDNNVSVYNWKNGNTGLPCGINGGQDQNNYKFKISMANNAPDDLIPVFLKDGEYFFEVVDTTSFVSGNGTNCLVDNSNLIQSASENLFIGHCKTVNPRFGVDYIYRWIVTRVNKNGGYTLQNKMTGNYFQDPVYRAALTTNLSSNTVYLYKNPDNTIRITSQSASSVCATHINLIGYNWNINTGACGTGADSSLVDYKFNAVIALPQVVPPVSILEEGKYKIENVFDKSLIFDNPYKHKFSFFDKVRNLLQSVELNKDESENRTRNTIWDLLKAVDEFNNNCYVLRNIGTDRFLSNIDSGKRITTSEIPVFLYIYQNIDNTYSIQDIRGRCLARQSGNPKLIKDTGYELVYWFENPNNICGVNDNSGITDYRFVFKKISSLPLPQEPVFTGVGGVCYIKWFDDVATQIPRVFTGTSSIESCNIALETARIVRDEISIIDPEFHDVGKWTPHISDQYTGPIYNYSGACMSINNTDGIIISSDCHCSDNKCNWTITPINGKYTVQNMSSNKYMSIPSSPSQTSLTTTTDPAYLDLNVAITPYQSYYMYFTNPQEIPQVCAYSSNTNVESISWSDNIGQVENTVDIYECGTDPSSITDTSYQYNSPNVNYQFNLESWCTPYGENVFNCYNNDGQSIINVKQSTTEQTFPPIVPFDKTTASFSPAGGKSWLLSYDSAKTNDKSMYDFYNVSTNNDLYYMSRNNYGKLWQYLVSNNLLPVDNPFSECTETNITSVSGINSRIILTLDISPFNGINPYKKGDSVYVYGVGGNTAANTDINRSLMYVYDVFPSKYTTSLNQIVISYENSCGDWLLPGLNCPINFISNSLIGNGNYTSGGKIRKVDVGINSYIMKYCAFQSYNNIQFAWPVVNASIATISSTYAVNYTNFINFINTIYFDIEYGCIGINYLIISKLDLTSQNTFKNGSVFITGEYGSGMTAEVIVITYLHYSISLFRIINKGTGYTDGDIITITQDSAVYNTTLTGNNCSVSSTPYSQYLSSNMSKNALQGIVDKAISLDSSINTVVLQSNISMSNTLNYANPNMTITFCHTSQDDTLDSVNNFTIVDLSPNEEINRYNESVQYRYLRLICSCNGKKDATQLFFPNKISQCANQIIYATSDANSFTSSNSNSSPVNKACPVVI